MILPIEMIGTKMSKFAQLLFMLLANVENVQARNFAGAALDFSGVRPKYLQNITSDFPNANSINRAGFVPDLQEGFVPQGLAVVANKLFLSGYLEPDNAKRTNCRLYTIDNKTFATLAVVKLPASCRHAGGLTFTKSDTLVVSDNVRLIVIPRIAYEAGSAKSVREIALVAPLKGTFLTARGGRIYLGSYLASLNLTRVFVFSEYVLTKETISTNDAIENFAVPVKSQGAAFDENGVLWTTSQDSEVNYINKIDKKSNALVRFPFIKGLQGIGVDVDGHLWSVSETGTLKYRHGAQKFPIVFRFDPAKLKPDH
jgi:hypothetical protein